LSYPVKFGFQQDFPDWAGYYVKHGFGTVQEILALLTWCETVRTMPLKSQWIHLNEGIKHYYVAVTCPFESISSNRLLQTGEEITLYLDGEPVNTNVEEEITEQEDPRPVDEEHNSKEKSSNEEHEGEPGANESSPDSDEKEQKGAGDDQPKEKEAKRHLGKPLFANTMRLITQEPSCSLFRNPSLSSTESMSFSIIAQSPATRFTLSNSRTLMFISTFERV